MEKTRLLFYEGTEQSRGFRNPLHLKVYTDEPIGSLASHVANFLGKSLFVLNLKTTEYLGRETKKRSLDLVWLLTLMRMQNRSLVMGVVTS